MTALREYRPRWLMPVLALLMALQLVACGDTESEQRKAFITYLQGVQIAPGGALPALNEEQRKRFGPYVNDYAILTTFSQQMNQAVSGSLKPLLAQVALIRVPQDYLAQRDNLRRTLGALNLLGQQVQSARTQADGARQALRQPEELQVIYQRVYTQAVIQPANGLLPLIPEAVSFAERLVQLGDYLQAQGDQVIFNGAAIQFPTPQQVAGYNDMVAALAAQQQGLMNRLQAQPQLLTP